MWWIIGIVVALLIISLFCYFLISGADMRRRNPAYGKQMDDEQEKILSQMRSKL